MPYRLIEHTADVIVEAEGACCARAFEAAAAGMYAVMVHGGTVRRAEWREVEVDGEGLEELLVEWLSELNFLTDTERLLFEAFEVRRLEPHHLSGRAGGEPFDPRRHEGGQIVKGITRHLLDVRQEPGRCRVTVTLDV
ncbi:MAG TPA: archease [Chloroflexota bacterium]|nr:archease [Chloroflexota bacterium]